MDRRGFLQTAFAAFASPWLRKVVPAAVAVEQPLPKTWTWYRTYLPGDEISYRLGQSLHSLTYETVKHRELVRRVSKRGRA